MADSNEGLRREADALMQKVGLPELLSGYSAWFVGGSYSYDLMCWRDLDIYILDANHDLQQCFAVAYELVKRLSAKKARFTNNVGGEPNGMYWGIKLGDERQGAWKWDVWFLDEAAYAKHSEYAAALASKLTNESRVAILGIKEAYWRRREYRDTVTSDHIYRAVLDHGIGSADEFAEWMRRSK